MLLIHAYSRSYITDIINGIISCTQLKLNDNGHKIYNLGNNTPVELKEFISLCEQTVNRKATIINKEVPEGDVPITYADIIKAHKELNYIPLVNLNNGLKETFQWMLYNIYNKMNPLYEIDDCSHNIGDREYLKYPNYYPDFQDKLVEFKNMIIDQVKNNDSKSYVHFGDGDYFFLKNVPVGSAQPGKRALSTPYHLFDIKPFRDGWVKADYHCVEYLEGGMRDKLEELYPGQKTIATEYLYGLTMNRWFTKQFNGKIGLIGAGPKLDIIKELVKYPEYREYIGVDKFNDYIEIPQKFACDNLENTIEMVKEQLEKADPETRVYLYGVGHVKSGLIHHLPKFKKAIYLDVGAGIDGLAGIIDPDRPYALDWINYRMDNYDYSSIDLLNYNMHKDKNKIIL
mgnify:FL=1